MASIMKGSSKMINQKVMVSSYTLMAVNMKGNFKKVKLKVKEYTEIQKQASN